jgi:hypothetical protein
MNRTQEKGLPDLEMPVMRRPSAQAAKNHSLDRETLIMIFCINNVREEKRLK